MPKFTAERLRQISIGIFRAAGVGESEAQTVSDHLVESNLAGVDSHGVIRIPQYIKALRTGRIVPSAQPKILQETPSSALIDGNGGFGQVIAQRAMLLAIQKAGTSTISAVSVFNCGHTGRLANYTTMAADREMVGIMMVNAGGGGQTVAPYGGIGRRLATNPISYAIPTRSGEHIVLDIATSVVSEGRIREMHNRKERIPEGWIIDHSGYPSTDTKDFYGSPPGALLPFGGVAAHKGFGLGLIVDILAGALSTAGCCRRDAPRQPRGDGVLAIVIDISRFTPLDVFYERIEGLISHIKSSPTAPGFDEIVIPGEREFRERRGRTKNGIRVNEATWSQIEEIAQDLGVSTK